MQLSEPQDPVFNKPQRQTDEAPHSVDPDKLPDKLQSRAFPHRAAAGNPSYLELRRIGGQEFLKERQDVKRIILSKKLDLHCCALTVSHTTYFLPRAISTKPHSAAAFIRQK